MADGKKKAKFHTGGSPVHVPTKDTQKIVAVWSAGSIEQELIARELGISRPTLVKHYEHELSVGKAVMDGLSVGTLKVAMMEGGSAGVAAAKWWQMSRMGWTERLAVDDGKPAGPMRVVVELVGQDAPKSIEHTRTRLDYDATNLVQLVG